MTDHLLLDPAIRDWVVLPMVAMMVLVGIGRHYAQLLMKSDNEVSADKVVEMRLKQVIGRAAKLRSSRNFICEEAFQARRAYFCRKKKDTTDASLVGALWEENLPVPQNPMMGNPMMMVDMMKGNVSFMVPNIAMMTFCSYFFAGFVCLKIPFTLPSSRFKLMLQRGIDLKSLDVEYVSTLSWYFLCSFGLRGLYQLILGQDVESDEARMMQMQMGMGGMGGPQGFDAKGNFKKQRGELAAIGKHDYYGDYAEKQLLGNRYPTTNDSEYEQINLSNMST